MAFVFQSQRWKQQTQHEDVSPNYYNPVQKFKPTGGLIVPQHHKPINRSQLSPQEQRLLISGLIEKRQRYHHQSSQKLFKRAQSAKLFKPVKSFLFDQSQKTTKITNDPLQINNLTNKIQIISQKPKKSTQSFKKINKYHHSNSQIQLSSTNYLFSDKNFRTQNSQKTTTPSETKQNFQFFNQCLKKQQQNQSKSSLNKFVQKKSKISAQNSFITNQPNVQLKNDQNFVIASGNCKKTSIKHTTILSNSQNELSQYAKIDPYEDVQTTAIDDDSYNEEDSFEYITNATPGPGEYELRKDKNITKSRVQKFGITQKRFYEPKKHEVILNLNANMPTFKKQSKASQEKVAFGKNRPQTSKQNYTDFLLYEDHQSIQNKSIKNLIKDRKDPGTFLTKTNRFEKIKKQAYFGPDFFQKDKQKPITLPDSTYMSKVQRHQRQTSSTANIDFQGQDCKTIKNKIEYLKERKQLLDDQTPGFYVSEPRFKYKQKQEGQQPILRYAKNSASNKKQFKAYTFRRQQIKQKSQLIDSPAPWAYTTSMKWVKPSHHVRYKF